MVAVLMADPTTPDEPIAAHVTEAAKHFDRTRNPQASAQDVVDGLFAGFAALSKASEAARRERKVAREAAAAERRARPEAIARRSAAAREGWETRRHRQAEASARDDYPPAPTGPVCDVMDHNSRGAEVFCVLDPGHDDDHDDGLGHTWPRGDWENDEQDGASGE
ncbi:hypothetical protein [Actinomadura bangladeshensis]|uniref:Uncharacterized protein n=1 Tax=Actinomadura bangladeshensis TaxID=453573 RepID=A0A6L9QC53_9ACTN|nr:hypothetical protein [Actinomadura bangladeshensis]NEA22648.1 hypothetical protein [Actinomadura bangladeshensis]